MIVRCDDDAVEVDGRRRWVAPSLLNKQIAYELGISEEAMKVHRGHAMRKLEIDSVPSLVRLLDRAAC